MIGTFVSSYSMYVDHAAPPSRTHPRLRLPRRRLKFTPVHLRTVNGVETVDVDALAITAMNPTPPKPLDVAAITM